MHFWLKRFFGAVSVVWWLSGLPVQAQTIDRLDTIGPYLGECVNKIMRDKPVKHNGVREVAFRLSFRSDGSLIGEPRRTFSMPNAEQSAQKLFVDDIVGALESCTPLLFSKSLGGAIAGRPFNFRYKLQPKQDLRA
jgi:hypothetical protein